MRPYLRILLIVAFAASAPVLCYSEEQPAPDETETNARLLERWRSDPEHYGRLQADLRAFTQLPAERQDRLRKLDEQLHDTDSITQKRMWGVIERYAAWYDRQPEADQRRIDKATDRYGRLQVVKELREEQWLARQPLKVRDDIAKLAADKRHDEIVKQRKDERQRFTAWMRAMKVRPDGSAQAHPTKPVRASDFPPEGALFINEVLKPQLTPEDREHLRLLEGKWPYYARLVLELSDKEKYKPRLPGPTGPVNFDKLPSAYQKFLGNRTELPDKVRKATGKWPDFAIEVTEAARQKDLTLSPLGPAHPNDFAPPLKQFIETTLPAKLSAKEKDELQKAEGRWPEYPAAVGDLAKKHGLEVPLMQMPKAGEWWDNLASALPEVPDRVLHDFALNDLTAEERAKLKLSVSDPTSRDRLVQEYFKKNPNELKRLERLDRQMLLDAAKPPKTKPAL
jgi:hypothetical protein